MTFNYLLLTRALLPEIALVLGALAVLGYDLFAGRHRPAAERLKASLAIGAIALVAALVDTLLVGTMGPVYGANLMLDTLAVAARCAAARVSPAASLDPQSNAASGATSAQPSATPAARWGPSV